MKKLNMNESGSILLFWAINLIIVIPVIIKSVSLFLKIMYFKFILMISMIMGFFLLLVLIILVVIEVNQDKRLNRFYEANKNVKVKVSDKFYEYQYCGNRKVKKDDHTCLICGGRFNN